MTPKLKPWLFLAMIFLAGILTGAALTIGLGPHFRPDRGAQEWKSYWMMYLTRQLNLSADQQAKIDPILTDSENQLQAVRKENVDKVSQIFQKANAQIAAILTPEQQTALQKLSKEMESRRDRMFPGHMHSWGQGGMGQHGGPGGGGMMLPPGSHGDQGGPPPPPPGP